jgi:DNA-binding transcriptional regulator LsrR (DeoR family)
VGVAGGFRKFTAILGALRGRFVNVLVTDRSTAERLLKRNAAEPLPEATA